MPFYDWQGQPVAEELVCADTGSPGCGCWNKVPRSQYEQAQRLKESGAQ